MDDLERSGCATWAALLSILIFGLTAAICFMLAASVSRIPEGSIAVLGPLTGMVVIGSAGFGFAWMLALVGAFFRRWVIWLVLAEAPFFLLSIVSFFSFYFA